ncbi:MAG TPA: phenylalanine--tRNA ligase subunit alpha, partial [Burkholderiaceae bacterium]|nr:phenylalanine--tRNA ligase subunit alpha [Burkholderiaceae bacterium]
MNDLSPLVQEARDEFERAALPAELENAKARYLGKAGRITEQLKALGGMGPDDKKARGALINTAKQQIEAALNARREALAEAELQTQLKGEALDVTLPGRQRGAGGGLHPISRARERIEAIFGS